MEDCLFCKIGRGDIPSEKEYESEKVFAIHDIHPKAPLHVLVIPKEHVLESMNDFAKDHSELLSEMFSAAKEIAARYGADKNGYKLLFNVGSGAGQSVMHLHLHILGKKSAEDKLPALAE